MSTPPSSIDSICANCGKGEESSVDLKSCTACKLVKYCNRDCQIAHRPQHKKACKKRAAELHDEALFSEPPPRKECPICMLPLPLYENHTGMTFHTCCGKLICNGCVHTMEESGTKDLCPFCRTPPPKSNEEEVSRINKLIGNGNANAFYHLAGNYAEGSRGMPQDEARANEIYLKAGELGCADAFYNVGNSYSVGRGVEIDEKKAIHYFQLAAMNGSINARHNLGCSEGGAGKFHQAFKHFIIAASAGYTISLDGVKRGYMAGHVTKEQYANTLREYQKSQDEMKSDARDKTLAAHNERMGG